MDVYRQNGVGSTGTRSFFCDEWIFAGKGHCKSGTYGITVGEQGVTLDRVTGTGGTRIIHEFANP